MPLGDLLTSSEKLTITAFKKVEREENGLSLNDSKTFTALVMGDTLSRSYSIGYQKAGGVNTSGQRAKYSMSNPQMLRLKLLLDNTGVFNTGLDLGPLTEPASISDQVEDFLKLCYEYDGELHEPPFLKVVWGKLSFSCKLQDLDVTYSIFDKGGEPLRAELDVSFLEDISNEERAKKEGKQSPDITHAQIVIGGDTLPLLSRKIYGSAEYYLELAEFNELDHFRELAPGFEVRFPPIAELQKIRRNSAK